MTDTSAIGARIRQARKAAGLSQLQLARLMGLQRPSVTEMELANRRVSSTELLKLSELLEVSTEWLLGVDVTDLHDAKAQLAARELAKLAPDDLDRLLELIASMRQG